MRVVGELRDGGTAVRAARSRTETLLSGYRLAEWLPLREIETMRKPVYLTRDEVDRVRILLVQPTVELELEDDLRMMGVVDAAGEL